MLFNSSKFLSPLSHYFSSSPSSFSLSHLLSPLFRPKTPSTLSGDPFSLSFGGCYGFLYHSLTEFFFSSGGGFVTDVDVGQVVQSQQGQGIVAAWAWWLGHRQ